ncbi:hypothetical protein [Sulfitobacter sp. JB4-11]|uniref:hypothetical protein n=1 Tax=Sulfitobacter rhodophyticola TaxID=3238304 RepID=UPI0035198F45
MSNNKILTVSYGTFSCTLEGFDDSFGTMKAIAEYFRDLASDDRYFGAEPPQPDAEMLARIAQKEISRRVEAHERDGKIVLSALEDQRSTTPTDDVAPVAAAAVATAAAATPAAADPAPAPVEAPAPAAEMPVAETPVAEAAAVESPQTETPVAAPKPAAYDEDGDIDIVPGQPDADVEAFFADSPSAEVEDDTLEDDEGEAAPLTLVSSNEPADAPAAEDQPAIEAEDVAPAAPATGPDSIAAKLERIRAVVASQSDTDDDEDYLEDEHADVTADEGHDSGVVVQARSDIEDALEADDAAESTAQADVAEDNAEEDELSAILSRLDGSDSAEDSTDADVVADAPEAAAEDEDISSTLDNLFENDEASFEFKSDDDAEDEVGGEIDDTVADEADEAPRARVIKVKRADLEAAIRKGALEEYDPKTGTGPMPALDEVAPARTPSSSLSPEDEADLVRELAELEADIKGEDGSEDTAADEATMPEAEDLVAEDVDSMDEEPAAADVLDVDAEADTPTADDSDAPAAARAALPRIDEGEGTDVNRLLAEADSQMDEPESATRRDAFAHLRAAVAARKADGTMDVDDDAKKDANAYRSDLADVVRPRRPEAPAEGARTARPDESRPAPLKLVAEQRIDVEQPRPEGPVRPRRVSAVADTGSASDADESFADYAADLGANKLPELLEAAASYMSFVEGREEFSRPQLMTKVRQAGPSGEFSREDGLRSFGQLLRSGKIEKIKGGRFTVSEGIGYRPDERAAG